MGADGLAGGSSFGLLRTAWAVEDDDGFGEAIVGARVVGIEEVLEEAEAGFEG